MSMLIEFINLKVKDCDLGLIFYYKECYIIRMYLVIGK